MKPAVLAPLYVAIYPELAELFRSHGLEQGVLFAGVVLFCFGVSLATGMGCLVRSSEAARYRAGPCGARRTKNSGTICGVKDFTRAAREVGQPITWIEDFRRKRSQTFSTSRNSWRTTKVTGRRTNGEDVDERDDSNSG